MGDKHTPGPWEVVLDTGLVRDAQTHREIAHCKYGTKKERHANAQFIVRACNAHDELLEACKIALSNIGPPAVTEHTFSFVKTKLQQAIVKATEKESHDKI